MLAGFGGFTLGGNVFNNTDFNEAKGAAAGLEFSFGAANVSVGYVFNDPDDGDSTNLVAVSGDVGLLQGSRSRATSSTTKTAPAPTRATIRTTPPGVVTVQLDY